MNARIVPFAGWEMPVQYAGVISEHLAVRNGAGLFDVSHMGEVLVTGKGAVSTLQYLTTNDVEKAVDGQCQYTLLCYPEGGVVDDCIVYRFSREKFLVCVNASNTDKAFEWMHEQSGRHAEIRNVSDEYAEIAVQGPKAAGILEKLTALDLTGIKRYHFAIGKVMDAEVLVSRTGYTGEDGFEIYCFPKDAPRLWHGLMEAGRENGIVPAGLGARDTLRLEMGYPLYGHELSENITPLQAGLKRFVAMYKPGFIGRDALKKEEREGLRQAVIGFEMLEPGVPRQGYAVRLASGASGVVASGTHSPSLEKGIGTALVSLAGAAPDIRPGVEMTVKVRERALRARAASLPFYSRRSVVFAETPGRSVK